MTKQAYKTLWREWASCKFDDPEHLCYLFDHLAQQRGGHRGALTVGLVLSVWSVLALAPGSLVLRLDAHSA